MALRLTDTYTNEDTNEVAKVYRDTDWQEYRVKFYINGVYQIDADYYDSDKVSAQQTAMYFANLL
jgi:hypothetical protein